MFTATQLNKVAEIIGTTDKNVVFSVVIKRLTDAGVDIKWHLICFLVKALT